MQNNLNFTINAAGRFEASFTSSGTLTVIQVNRDQEAPLYVEVSADNGAHRSVLASPVNDKNVFAALDVPEGLKVYITSLVNVSYASYNQSELTYYTKDEVDAKIAQLYVLEPAYADTLPTASADTMKKLYFVPKSESEENNASDEFITVRIGAGTELDPYTYAWEQVGDTSFQVQADWSQTNTSAPDYIKNKPTIPTVPTMRTMNGEQLTDSSLGDINIHDGFYFPNAVQDYDGNWYGAVVIGDQVWLGENLRTIHDALGNAISGYYDNEQSQIPLKYRGLFYNKAAVMNGDTPASDNDSVKGIAPDGWHIPSMPEFGKLVNYLHNNRRYSVRANNTVYAVKSLCSTTNWMASDVDYSPGKEQEKNNATGFNAYPVGMYNGYNQESQRAYFHTSKVHSSIPTTIYNVNFAYNDYAIYYNNSFLGASELGFSVRCVSDLTPLQFRDWYIRQYGSLQHTLAETNVQSDWNQSDSNADDFIKNKPTLGTASALNVPASGNASGSEVVKGNDSRLTDARNAADVYQWAKEATKPSYTAQEVGAIPATEKGSAGGVAELDNNGTIPTSQLPDISWKADKVNNATADDFATLDSNGNLKDSGKNANEWDSAISESIAETRTEVDNLRKSLKNGGTAIKASKVNADDYHQMGVPMVLVSTTAGAPSSSVVPVNWDNNVYPVWNGTPLFVGQIYVDPVNGKVYFAYKVTGSTGDWTALN